MGRLHAAEGLDHPAPLNQLVHVAADRHFRDVQEPGQVLVRADPHGIEMVDNGMLAFGWIHRDSGNCGLRAKGGPAFANVHQNTTILAWFVNNVT